MNTPNYSPEKNVSPAKKPASHGSGSGPVSWFQRIDYLNLSKRAGELFWKHRKRLLALSILLVLTGGQAITMNSSFTGQVGGENSSPEKSVPFAKNPSEDWRETLSKIEDRETLKSYARHYLDDKKKLHQIIGLVSFIAIAIFSVLILLFFANCHLHLALIRTVNYLDQGLKKSKGQIKKEVQGKWKSLALMRILFGLLYLATLVALLIPPAILAWQQNWPLAATFFAMAIVTIVVAFIFLSYVFRYSLLCFAASGGSIKESIDRGYELFTKNWKESVLTSVVNFALGIVAGIVGVFIILAVLLALALIGIIIGSILFLLLGKAHLWGIGVGVGITVVLIPLIIVGIVLASVWQGFVVIFWFLVFKELAGCKIESCEEVAEMAKELKRLKGKKPAVKPVAQKEK